MLPLIKHACIALYPRTDALPGVADTELDTFLRRFRQDTTFLMWLGVVAGTLIFELSPLITVYLPLPAFLLPRRVLDRHAERIASHRVYLLRQAIVVVKLVAGMCWAMHPTVRAHFAMKPYPPEPNTWRTS